MSHLAIHMLGPMQVTLDGEPVVRFRGDTVQALLSYLVMHPGIELSREVLAGLLWPDYRESEALVNLRQTLRRLRTAIGDESANPPFLIAARTTLAFDPESDYWLDVAAFDRALAETQAHAHPRLESCPSCVQRLAEAAELYRGEFLQGFSLDSALFEEWMVVERERLHLQALEALGHLAAYHEESGEYGQTLAYARRQVELEPWRESAHRQWMRALALSGQRGAALAQYESCRRILADELGVEPEPETTALYERIKSGGELTIGVAPPPHNLPAQLTPFIGRERELAEIAERLADPACRLLTLVGPGGSGKTRLALEVAAQQVQRFADGAFFVSLAPLQSTEAIVPTIAQALGFAFYGEGDPLQQLLNYLWRRNVLLLLDNFEHLLSGVDIVMDILRTAPEVVVLATSRARLNVRGEQLIPLGGMPVPAQVDARTGGGETVEQFGAVQLFLSRALRVRPNLKPTADDLAHVAQICRRVEGMPLAILLAAAWMEMLTPAEIEAEIEGQMTGLSIDFLEADERDAPARQRSMRAVYNHSWSLLSEREQKVCAGLSVFRGGFTREAAQQVSGASLRDLMALVSRSLLHRASTGRYGMHELLRQYAAEKLDDLHDAGESVRDRHAAYFAAALEQWATDLKGARQQAVLAEIEADVENARTAWDWAVQSTQEELLGRAIDGLGMFYDLKGRLLDGQTLCQAAAQRLAGTTSARGLRALAKVLTWQSIFSRPLGQAEQAGRALRQSLATLERDELADQDTRPERAFALLKMGDFLHDVDRGQAEQAYVQSLDLYRESDDHWGMARVLSGLSGIAMNAGDLRKAQQLGRESLELARAVGDRAGIASALWRLSNAAGSLGQWEECERLSRERLEVCQEMGGPMNLASGLAILGPELVLLGKFDEARRVLEETLAIVEDLGWRRGAGWASLWLGVICMHQGSYEKARSLADVAYTVYHGLGNRWGTARSLLLLSEVALAVGAHSQAEQQLQRSVAIYRELGQKAELGQALIALAYAARALGRAAEAWQHLRDVLQIANKIRYYGEPLYVLPALALFLAEEGEAERALELCALASRDIPLAENSRWFEDVAGKHITAAAATLPPGAVAAAQERGRARDLWAAVAELLAELEDGEHL